MFSPALYAYPFSRRTLIMLMNSSIQLVAGSTTSGVLILSLAQSEKKASV